MISVLDSLSPRFGWTLAAGTGYCGVQAFFEDGRLVSTIPDHDLHAIDDESDGGPPDSLLEALRQFYVGVAVQAYHRGRNESTQEHRSMLVHPSMRKMDHYRFKRWVEGATESWIELLDLAPGAPDREELVRAFRYAYDELADSAETHQQQNDDHEKLPPFEDVLVYLPPSMRSTLTWEVNSRVLEGWTQDNWNSAPSHILVGGENLGRGFTVNGLTTTYMPRGRGGGVADTIQQRGRFFGYKRDYDTRKDQPASAGARIVHSGSDGMGDNVMGSFRTNRPPRGRRLGRGRGFRTFRLVRRWFRHESGGIERIAWPLTGSVCSFIVRSIPEGLMFREFSSIWEIQAKRH